MFQKVTACLLVLGATSLAQGGALDRHVPTLVKTPTTAVTYDVHAGVQDSLATVDIGGNPSYGALGDPSNVVILFDLGTGGVDATVTGVGWDVGIEAFSPSWQSEATIGFLDSTEGLQLSPGAGTDTPGVGAFASAGIVDFSDLGLLDILAPGGIMTLELFETFDDSSVAPDGMWLTPSAITFEFTAVPEPGILSMFGLALCGLARRRRK